MKKVCVIGHFGIGKNLLNGQTIKTKIVTAEIERKFGTGQIVRIDTHGGIVSLYKIVPQTIKAFKQCKNIIIFPAYNGIRIFVPLCTMLNKLYHRNLHYVVVGGWLNDFLREHKDLSKDLREFTGIYVETSAMKSALNDCGFDNIYIMPNFKDITILNQGELVYSDSEPYRICTFSRVMKEKGIGEAIEAVKAINNKYKRTVFTLDIYGMIDSRQEGWFNELKKYFPKYITYKGSVPFNQSVSVLKDYYALLFPTYYNGEGFAGTLIDAMAAGVPVIASDWKYNSEIVVPGKTGILIAPKDSNQLTIALENTMGNKWNLMKDSSLQEAIKYIPETASLSLMNNLE